MNSLAEFLANWQKRKVLMVIYPHPDDESMAAGGVLMAAKELGYKTVVVCLTRGGAGKVHTNLRGRSLKEVRSVELGQAIKLFGVSALELGDFEDGKLRSTESQWSGWVLKLIKKYRPGIIVTYDHSGLSGHPDHIILSLVVKKILLQFPVTNRSVMLWTVLAGTLRERMLEPKVASFTVEPTHYLDLGAKVITKWRAARVHRSQGHGTGLPIPLLLGFVLFGRREWYYEVDLDRKYPYKFVSFDF